MAAKTAFIAREKGPYLVAENVRCSTYYAARPRLLARRGSDGSGREPVRIRGVYLALL